MSESSNGYLAHLNQARDVHVSDAARVHIGNTYNSTTDRSLSQRQSAILKSLSTLPCRDRKDINPRRVPDTCEWFLAHPLFQQWRDGQYCMLWVSAEPGCGKSVLVRHLIDHELLDRPVSGDAPPGSTCYFFFKDGLEDQRTLQGALRCLLHQVFSKRRDLLSEAVLDRFDTQDYLIKSTRGLWELFLEITRSPEAGQIILLLDAVDECEEDSRGELYELLDEFLNEQGSGRSTNLKLLLSSRPNADIRIGLRGLPMIHLKGETDEESNKIAQEIRLVIEHQIERLRQQFSLPAEYKDSLRGRLMSVENRTYLWARLTLDLIRKDLRAGRQARMGLEEKLPQDIEEAYSKILTRSPQPDLTMKVLHIVLASTRPLSLSEVAVAMHLKEDGLPPQNTEEHAEEALADYLRDLCGLFTIVDSKLSLLHQTVREFLVKGDVPSLAGPTIAASGQREDLPWRHSITTQEMNLTLTKACIRALLPEQDTKPLFDTVEHLPSGHVEFCRYAAMTWHIHARRSGYSDVDMMRKLCVPKTGLTDAWHWFTFYYSQTMEEAGFGTNWHPLSGFTPVQVASYCGILPLVQWCLANRDLREVISSPSPPIPARSALSLAAEQGFSVVAKEILLCFPPRVRHLFRDNPLEWADSEGRTPLATAAYHGQEEVVALLLREGARVDVKDSYGNSPLTNAVCAAYSGKDKAVDLLVTSPEQSVNQQVDRQLGKSLFLAITHNRKGIAKRIIDTGRVNLNATIMVDDRRSPRVDLEAQLQVERDVQWPISGIGWPRSYLGFACYLSTIAMVRLLVEGNANIHQVDRKGATALHWAADAQQYQIVSYLLDMGLDPNARTAKGATPLSLVYEPFMIKDLVIKGARIEDGEAWSPERQECARAIMRECKLEGDMEWWRNSGSADSVHVKLLLLQLSIFCGREDLLYGIIGPGLSPGYKDRHSGWHIIHFAVVFPRSRGCLRNLLQLGVDPICRNDRQATPMVLAIKNRNSEAVAEILESETWRSTHKTIPPSIHPDRNVLFDAISADHVETIKVLLENGYDPNYIRDGYGTPLYYALELNSPNLRRAVETLLYFGARAEHLNLVDLLSMMGKWRTITVVVELLLSNGADPNSKMDGYETPLHRISRASEHAEAHQVVKILLKHGADPTILDEHGLTPLEHAIQRSREQHPFNDILNSIVDSLQQAMDSRRS